MNDPRYPIGPFVATAAPTPALRREWISAIAAAPEAMRAAIAGLDDEQLGTPYRDGGWTVRQVVHHVPDSHMNGYIRTCLALTEDEPTIRPYDENGWAALPFMRTGPVEGSLDLLTHVHARWLAVLNGMEPADFARRFLHPDNGIMTLDAHIENYAWHGRHHVAHITSLRERRGW
ncbi:MAG TPA: putative metal-dependent hydrolase [Longimicrobiales bacterium]|nr:putative metal-dependent hydrolase [Longimicrobiales bacterium]